MWCWMLKKQLRRWREMMIALIVVLFQTLKDWPICLALCISLLSIRVPIVNRITFTKLCYSISQDITWERRVVVLGVRGWFWFFFFCSSLFWFSVIVWLVLLVFLCAFLISLRKKKKVSPPLEDSYNRHKSSWICIEREFSESQKMEPIFFFSLET